jgi:sugar (pentulose or hexulose) kinase
MSAPPGSDGLIFIPYLEGERTPPLPNARGQLVGLTLSNMTPANIARATIEGVLWSLAYGCRRCGLRLARSADHTHWGRGPVGCGPSDRSGGLRATDRCY